MWGPAGTHCPKGRNGRRRTAPCKPPSAERGFALWRRVSAYDRAMIMRRAGDLLRERRDHLANLMTLEQGKTLPESRVEVSNLGDIV